MTLRSSPMSQSLVRHALTITVLGWCLVEGAAQQPAKKVTSKVDVNVSREICWLSILCWKEGTI